MLSIISTYTVALTTFLIIDLFWANIAASELYRRSLGDYLAAVPQPLPSLLLHALLVAGLMYFVIWPARREKNQNRVLARAAFYGLLTSATYNLTSLSVADGWPISITIIDIIWGVVLSTATVAITQILMVRISAKWPQFSKR